MEEQNTENQREEQSQEVAYGPRPISFFTLVLKTFAGFMGGVAGTIVLVLIFLATSSILQPVLGGAAELSPDEINPLFTIVLVSMVFATSLVSSMVGALLLGYTERERYTRISTTMGQIFIMNIVIFAFIMPVYLIASTTSIAVITAAATLQVIFSAIAGSLMLELIHDARYPLLVVYETLLAILAAMAVGFMLFAIIGNTTILMFIALPMIWGFLGFFHAAVSMFYYWIFSTWGTDYLATETQFGTDYGIPDESEEDAVEEEQREDVEGGDFLNQ